MVNLNRRCFLCAVAAGTVGLLRLPRSFGAALKLGVAPPRIVVEKQAHGPVLIMVVAAGLDLDPAAIPEPYRIGVHVCFPPSRRACWCGGWHAPDDPADFVIVAGPDAGRWRFGENSLGLAVLPAGHRPHPDLSTLRVPAVDLLPTSTLVIEHIAEGVLVPGLIGFDFADVRSAVGRGRDLHFAHAVSSIGIVHAADQAVANSGGWLRKATDLLVRHTGNENVLLCDINESCERVIAACSEDTCGAFYATIQPGTQHSVVAVLGASSEPPCILAGSRRQARTAAFACRDPPQTC